MEDDGRSHIKYYLNDKTSVRMDLCDPELYLTMINSVLSNEFSGSIRVWKFLAYFLKKICLPWAKLFHNLYCENTERSITE